MLGYHYNEQGMLTCTKCGSHRFILDAELVIFDVSKLDDDPLANRSIESERIISVMCAECRHRIK